MKYFFSPQQKFILNLFQFIFIFFFSLNGMEKAHSISETEQLIIGTVVSQDQFKTLSYYEKAFPQYRYQVGEFVGVKRSDGQRITQGKIIKPGWTIQINDSNINPFASDKIGNINQEIFNYPPKLGTLVSKNIVIEWNKNLHKIEDIVAVPIKNSLIWGKIKFPIWLVIIERGNGKIKKNAWCDSERLYKLKKNRFYYDE